MSTTIALRTLIANAINDEAGIFQGGIHVTPIVANFVESDSMVVGDLALGDGGVGFGAKASAAAGEVLVTLDPQTNEVRLDFVANAGDWNWIFVGNEVVEVFGFAILKLDDTVLYKTIKFPAKITFNLAGQSLWADEVSLRIPAAAIK